MTAHYATISSAIRNRMKDNWTTTPILYENLDASRIKTDGASPEAFVVCEIIYLTHQQADIGSPNARRYRTRGIIRLHVMVPKNRGDGLGLEYADTLAAIFRGKTFSGVVCSEAGIRESGVPAGQYWRTVLGIDFYSDQIFNVA